MSLTYSPCSYVRPNTLPASPASCSSGCSGSSPTGYQPPMAYATDSCGQNRYYHAPLNESTLPYAVYMGYRSRERKRDDDVSLLNMYHYRAFMHLNVSRSIAIGRIKLIYSFAVYFNEVRGSVVFLIRPIFDLIPETKRTA